MIKQLIEQQTGLEVIEEFRFNPQRRWRFDYYIEKLKLGIEINGGIFSGGRHVRGTGFLKDMEKLNSAQILGFKVLQYTPDQIDKMLEDIKELKSNL